eukprot:XP_025004211.1 activating transcription factor 7-interacting protein 1 isoform X3 [Gallus gallus]
MGFCCWVECEESLSDWLLHPANQRLVLGPRAGPRLLPRFLCGRVKMDNTDEPQKKVFKARKTMRASDRQQLEAVYKAKEDLLKTTEVKLLNGKHENGDSDLNSPLSNTDCTEDKREVNGLVDSNEISEIKRPESRAESVVSDLEPKPLSPENVTREQDTDVALVCEAENRVLGSNKVNFHEENNIKNRLDQRESDAPSGENKSNCDNSFSPEEKGKTNDITIISNSPVEEKKKAGEIIVEDTVGEEAISSSMETDQEPKNESDGTAGLSETVVEKAVDESSESILENTDSMEADEIIPILEKLAPAEDEMSCFSKSALLPVDDTAPDLEEKMDNCLSSPLKQESNESLPKEAFLVLSDEEDPCDEREHAEVILPNKSGLPEEVEKSEEEDKEREVVHKEEEKHTERGEVSRRKRSKSEDMDSVHSKRRRFVGEEDYEAEFQVKITARRDVDQKLEKAKITRLTKRFGAAKEDMKKKQENTPNPSLSSGKAASSTANANNLTYRNITTVRQMLESKRNVGDSKPATLQAPVSAAPASSLAAPQTPASGHPKPQTPVTSSPLTTTVISTANTATVVGTSQVPSGSTQPMSVSLQSLPVILHVPVAVSSQPQLLQGHAGTLVTNQQSGSVEFISVQSSSTVGSLTKTAVSLASTNTTKPNNSPSVSSPGVQRNSPASAGSVRTTLAVQAVSTTHPVAQTTRTSLPTVGTSGLHNSTSSRGPIHMKIPLSAFNSTAPTEPPTITAPRVENQTSRPPTDSSANKRTAEGPTQLSEQKVVRCVPYTCGIFDGTTLINCFEKQLKQEETSSENKEAVEAAQMNFNFPEDVLFGLEEEEEDAKSIKNTHKQTGWAANLLKQWLAKNGKDPSFELVPVSELNDILREFYCKIRNHDGNTYSVASYKSMRAGLNRHLKMPPYNRQICLMKDKEFASANMVFVSMLRMLRIQGKDETHHHPPIAADDLRKIKLSGVLGLHSPVALVNKVWFDLQLHFTKRGREILRDLAPDAFVVEKDKNGRRYAVFRYPGKGKNGEDPHKMGKMYDMPGDPNCPVFSLELYLSKLPPEPPAFYLHPLKLTAEQMKEQPVWYKREPMGVNYLGAMMPRISVAARLSQRYTNHSLRTTTIQLLCEAGLGPGENYGSGRPSL